MRDRTLPSHQHIKENSKEWVTSAYVAQKQTSHFAAGAWTIHSGQWLLALVRVKGAVVNSAVD